MKKTIYLTLIIIICISTLSYFGAYADVENANDIIPGTENAYINNKYTGKYMMGNSNTLTSSSGTLSSMGTLIKWIITPLGNNVYTIQSGSNTSLYLSASSSATNPTVYLTTLDDASIPNRYRWKFSTASGGGCIIKNIHTSNYLYSTGTSISSISMLGVYGTSLYMQQTWRIAESTNYYGNGTGFVKKELPEGYQFKTLFLFAGQTKSPSLLDIYDNVLFNNAYDFTYTGYDSSCVSYDPLNGKFTISSTVTTLYTATLNVTHKVTGRTATLFMAVNPRCVSVGIPAVGHDHSSCLSYITPYIVNCGYSGNTTFFGTYSVNTIRNTLALKPNNMFVSRSHGGVLYDGSTAIGTAIQLSDETSSTVILFRSDTSMSNLELSNMKLVAFIACQTGYGGENSPNLPHIAVQNGATTAIGFKGDIPCGSANGWTKTFFKILYEEDYNVNQAVIYLNNIYSGTGLYDPTICGNKYIKINNN